MNVIRVAEGEIKIALSRRNLLYLLKALDLNVSSPALHRWTDKGLLLVKAEEDDQHYNSEQREEPVRGIKGVGPDELDNPRGSR